MALASFCGYDKLGIKRNMLGEVDEDTTPMNGRNMFTDDWCRFEMPAVAHPATFVKSHFESSSEGTSKVQFLKGTTTLAFIYEPATPNDQGGIIVAVDSRASGGNYVASSTVMKIIQVTDNIVGTMAGGASDCQFWLRNLSKQCRLYELQNKDKLSVAAASKLVANMLYNYKGSGIQMGSMIAGHDKRGACLYFVDSEGVRVKGKLFTCGSGSLNAYGILDSNIQPKMTDQAACDLGQKAIMHATNRDCGSGGFVRVIHISQGGIKKASTEDANDLIYKHFGGLQKDAHEPNF